MHLKGPAIPPLSAPVGSGLRQAGAFVIVIGLLLLSMAAGDALAGADLGDLRGSGANDRLAGFGGGDMISGLAGDDEIYGGAGDDEIYAGEGRDVLLGGPGDDFLETKDGERDYVDCGAGDDAASVDMEDRVSRTCESVYAA